MYGIEKYVRTSVKVSFVVDWHESINMWNYTVPLRN